MKPEYALSIKPPWAYFIIYGIPYGISIDNGDGTQSVKDSGKVILKNIENRDWRIGREPAPGFHRMNHKIDLPARIYVHVSKKEEPIEPVLEFCVGKLKLPMFPIMLAYSTKMPRGAVIGEVDITDCVTESKSPWFVGKYGFVLANPVAYDKPIACRGMLGFFKPDLERLALEGQQGK